VRVSPSHVIERAVDLPRSIVWSALVDPDLAEGWLHPTERLVAEDAPFDPGAAEIEVVSERLGRLRVELIELPGGTRGSGTLVRLELREAAVHPALVASWNTRLDQLEDLLRGHPVDWANWERDRGGDFADHLRRARGAQ